MDKLFTLLNYYIRSETDELEIMKEEETKEPSSSNSSSTIHIHNNNIPWWTYWWPSNHTTTNNNHYYGSSSKSSSSSSSSSSSDSSSKNDSKDNKAHPIIALLIFIITIILLFCNGSTYVKYNRIMKDEEECDSLLLKVNNQKDRVTIYEAKSILHKYYKNRSWSLLNHVMLFLGGGCMTLSLAFPNLNTNLFSISIIITCIALLSGALRCGLWYGSEKRYRLRLKEIQSILSTPPIYASAPPAE